MFLISSEAIGRILDGFLDKTFEYGVGVFLVSVLVMAVMAFGGVQLINRAFRKREKQGKANSFYVRKTIGSVIYFLFLMGVVIQISPLKNLTLSLFAGSSILALAVSFASQDAVSNIVGGLLIKMSKPFTIGDRIAIGGNTGVVESMTLRQTVLVTVNNTRIVIPNSTVNNSTIENFTLADNRIRATLSVSVAYGTDLAAASELLREIAQAHPNCIDARSEEEKQSGVPKVNVYCGELGAASIRLDAPVWAEDIGKSFTMMSDLRKEAARRFKENGIEIPYPYTNVVIKKE